MGQRKSEAEEFVRRALVTALVRHTGPIGSTAHEAAAAAYDALLDAGPVETALANLLAERYVAYLLSQLAESDREAVRRFIDDRCGPVLADLVVWRPKA